MLSARALDAAPPVRGSPPRCAPSSMTYACVDFDHLNHYDYKWTHAWRAVWTAAMPCVLLAALGCPMGSRDRVCIPAVVRAVMPLDAPRLAYIPTHPPSSTPLHPPNIRQKTATPPPSHNYTSVPPPHVTSRVHGVIDPGSQISKSEFF